MIEVRGNLWNFDSNADVRVITTNGTVKENGRAVMGRGCAREAAKRFPDLPRKLGIALSTMGNVCYRFGPTIFPIDYQLVTFPVKHDWFRNADLALIYQSACQLADMVEDWNWKSVIMPRPGCGNGHLKWHDVKPLIQGVLDDRFYVITFA